MVSYNREPIVLNTAIRSIESQTHQNWNLMIIDDASHNGETLRALYAWEKRDQRIKVEYLDFHMGAQYCKNLGIQLSKGQYISFIADDEFYHP